jgi:hypothetical protein
MDRATVLSLSLSTCIAFIADVVFGEGRSGGQSLNGCGHTIYCLARYDLLVFLSALARQPNLT